MKYTYFATEGLGRPFVCVDDKEEKIYCFLRYVPPGTSYPELDAIIKLYTFQDDWVEFEPGTSWFQLDWVQYEPSDIKEV